MDHAQVGAAQVLELRALLLERVHQRGDVHEVRRTEARAQLQQALEVEYDKEMANQAKAGYSWVA